MLLRSGKILIKRIKHSSHDIKTEEGEDFISKLPDAVLIHILSLLPEADANRTRFLSNRWKLLSAFLPNLRFVCWSNNQVNKLHDSVHQTLALRGGMPVQRFFLHIYACCDYNCFYDLLRTVFQSKVKELELRFGVHRYGVRFYWDFFKTSNSLVGLTLKGAFILDVPEAVLLFPCLKKINLVTIAYSGDQSLENLISCCPVLEELFVDRQFVHPSDNLQTVKVSSPSLKRLRISFAYSTRGDHKFVIDAPQLEYLDIWDYMSSSYLLTQPLSLVEAKICINSGSIVDLITYLTSARIMTLTNSTMQALNSVHGLNLPMFPNLIELVIGIHSPNSLLILLNRMPNLERIIFSDRVLPFSFRRYYPMEAPDCLRFKVKEIIMLKALIPEDLIVIWYLLKYSNNLETFTINACNIDPKIREQLLNFRRGSSLCRIEFV